ncbi:MAG: DNA repair protein, partial [Lachnospiraceae bacterium]|nr:DNA repair protein [Lachnospiraceae bacterium]
MKERIYLCIDLKSFYASVECAERHLDAMTTNLVVADMSRTEKTICLAITPAMKALGIHNRCRIFEIPPHVKYIAATPRMQLYIDYAAEIYSIYLKYISKDDIHVYSIDEAFMDVTDYLSMYGLTARELGMKIVGEIHSRLNIHATCGIGTNLYLAKIALDISAKHSPDFIGELTEESYRQTLWHHKPLTDFWRVGAGTAKKLAGYGILTMEDIARADEDFLYHLFGID